MSRQYSVDDIAKYKAGSVYRGSGYFNSLDSILYPVSGTPIDSMQILREAKAKQAQNVVGSGFGLENIILSNYKMPKSKKIAQAIHQEMFGTGMDEDEMEGDGISEWMSNLSKLFKLLKIRATM